MPFSKNKLQKVTYMPNFNRHSTFSISFFYFFFSKNATLAKKLFAPQKLDLIVETIFAFYVTKLKQQNFSFFIQKSNKKT